MSSSVPNHTAHGVERPERSRNAKAQARHRAKRKAYIEQLEQTVTKLQITVGCTPEQISALPPPLIKIRELEQEIIRLQKENDDLRNLVAETNVRGLSGDLTTRRNLYGNCQDTRLCDRNDHKRRKHVDGVYLSPSDTPLTDSLRPPPLIIPQPITQHYGNLPSSVTNHNGTSPCPPLTLLGPMCTNTPSGSSSTSSPPFSPIQMQSSNHHLPSHRPPSMTNHSLSSFPSTHSYESIKIEDENHPSHPLYHNQYPITAYTHTPTSANINSWSSYPSERVLHR
ncbi:hypothetical protein Ac2012v2_007552 [Leucoagaricus gongylophorus]